MQKKLDKAGVEIKDFDPTIKFFKTTCRDAITERIKELKEKYPRESTEMYMEGSIISYDSYNYLLEYSGNEENNREFKGIIEKFDILFKYFVDFETMYSDLIDFLTNTKKYKTSKDLNKHISEYRKRKSEMMKNGNELSEKMTGEVGTNSYELYKRYIKLIRKFSIKYSNVTLEYKKNYAEKFASYYDKLSKVWDDYASEEYADKTNNELERIKDIDFALGSAISKEAVTHINKIRDNIDGDLDKIKLVTGYLDTGIANTLRYKVVQALLKK